MENNEAKLIGLFVILVAIGSYTFFNFMENKGVKEIANTLNVNEVKKERVEDTQFNIKEEKDTLVYIK